MTKAERIFENTYRECRNHVKSWGCEPNTGFNRMAYKDNECFYKRTFNAVQRLIDAERKRLEIRHRVEAISEERYTFLSNSLNMVQTTLNNTRII